MTQHQLIDRVFSALSQLFEKLEESHEITGVHHGRVYKENGCWNIKLPRPDSELSELLRIKINGSDNPEHLDVELLCGYVSDGRGELPGGFCRIPIGDAQ